MTNASNTSKQDILDRLKLDRTHLHVEGRHVPLDVECHCWLCDSIAEIERLRPMAESWESYEAAQERKVEKAADSNLKSHDLPDRLRFIAKHLERVDATGEELVFAVTVYEAAELAESLSDETTAEHSVQEAAIYQAGYEHGQRDARMPAVETSAPLQCVCGEVRVWAYTTKIETATSIHYPDKPCHQRDPEHVKATACIHIWTVSGRIGNPLPDQLCDHGCGLRYADRFAVNGGEKHDL